MKRNGIVKNSMWIISCKIVQAILTLVITALTARYLGPSDYGLINYAAALTAFFVPLMQLGFRNTLVQEFVEDPQSSGEILGTSITLNILSALACMVGIFSFTFLANAGDRVTVTVCILYSFNLIFQALEMVQYWFQANLMSRYQSVISLAAYLIVSVYKAVLLYTNQGIYWFAVAQAVDYAIIAIALLLFYRKLTGQSLSFSRERGRRMFRKSKYYILSNIMVTIFGYTDKIMLQLMAGDAETGYYSAALTCATMTGFIFAAIIDSARPVIFENKKVSQQKFESSLTVLYTVSIYFALAQSIVITLFAPLIIAIMYGSHYAPAVSVLQIIVWFTTFSNLGSVRNIWILAEDKYRYLWKINICGAAANIVLNAFLIPLWGTHGAAFASLVTQMFTNVVVGFLFAPIRRNNMLMLKGLDPRNVLKVLRK